MSKIDEIFKSNCIDIIENETFTEGQKVRPIWEDTKEPAYTIKKFGVCNRYNLQEEFPILTLRRNYYRSAIDEWLWIYQKKSNKVSELNSHVWDQWAGEDGTIGKAYGYQVGHSEQILTTTHKNMNEINPYKYSISNSIEDNPIAMILDQTDYVLHELKHNPFSRRIVFNLYNINELNEMNLHPCAFCFILNVTEKDGIKYLNGNLIQRSQDMLTANSWNVMQYASGIMMFAQVSGMVPGELVHMITDCHIYDRHIPIIKDLLKLKGKDSSKMILNPEVTNFYDFKPSDFTLEGYEYETDIKNIPMAI